MGDKAYDVARKLEETVILLESLACSVDKLAGALEARCENIEAKVADIEVRLSSPQEPLDGQTPIIPDTWATNELARIKALDRVAKVGEFAEPSKSAPTKPKRVDPPKVGEVFDLQDDKFGKK